MKRMRRAGGLLLVLMLLVSVLPIAVMAKETGNEKIINVVYDDSRSMYLGNQTRWCQAKYAMEVFCAMMGEEDVMNIYSMNREDILTIRGSDRERVEKVHAMTSMYSGTPFETVLEAGESLSRESSASERWLVVLTDGSFDNTAASQVQSTLDGYNDAGIKTVYLAIGDGAVELAGDHQRGAYAEKAAASGDILTKVTSIANQIFEHQVLGSQFISASGSDTVLNIDIPTDQIVIFAQGEGASVGEMSLNGKVLKPVSTQSVKHSGDVMPLNNEQIPVDTSLHGVLVTYEADGNPFESGEFTVSVSNATAVEYYYRPGVTVSCALVYRDKPVESDEELYAGDYEVALSFVNPMTGETVESELLSDAKFKLSVLNNGEEQLVEAKTGTVSLEAGDVEIEAIAELPGNVFLTSEKTYTVVPKMLDLGVRITPEEGIFGANELKGDAAPYVVEVINLKTGELLTEHEWDLTELEVSDADNITWEIAKGKEAGTWELKPLLRKGKTEDVQASEHSITVFASYQDGNQYAEGSGSFRLVIEQYMGNELEIEISKPTGEYDLNDFKNPESMLVTVRYEDAKAEQFYPLTEEMWDSFELKGKSDKNMSWKIEKGTEVGTWVLTPAYYHGDVVLTGHGDMEVTVTAEGEDGPYVYAGSGSQTVQVLPLTIQNMIKELLPRIIGWGIVLFFVIGHLFKKRLKTGRLNPHCEYDGITKKRRIKKNFLSVVMPFVPETAVVECSYGILQCNFPNLKIKASGKGSFRILNRTINQDTVEICGSTPPDPRTLHKTAYRFRTFSIASIDRESHTTLGEFHFI